MILDPLMHRFIIGGLFLIAGALHFLKPGMYIGIMPDYLPHHRLLVFVSGAAEILGGIGLMLPLVQNWAAWGLILLLIAVFPANIDMAWKGYKGYGLTAYTLLLLSRLPLQFLLIYWVYWAGIKN